MRSLGAPYDAWSVHPATRCVTSPSGDKLLEHIGPLHSANGALLFRRKNEKYRKSMAIIPDLDASELQGCAKLEHELDHIQKFCGTSYGFLVHALHSAKVDLFLTAIELADDKLSFPVFPRASAPWSGGESSAESFESCVNLFWSHNYLLSMLECTSGAPTTPLPWQRKAAFEISERYFGPLREDTPGGDLNCCPDDGAFPIINLGGRRPTKLGGQGLLEFFAVSREATVLKFSGLSQKMDYRQQRSHLHTQAAKAWKHWAKLPMLEPPISESWRSAGLGPTPQFPLESRIAMDIALWPPFYPNVGCDHWRWTDIHPGWRYLKVLLHLKDQHQDYHLFMSADDVSDEWFLDFEDTICNALAWPSPAFLASKWLEYWERRAVGPTDRRFICDDIGRARATIELLATRVKRPFLMVMSYPGAESRNFHWFEAITTWQDHDGRITMLSPEGHEEEWAECGYRLPVGFAMVKALDLFGTGDWKDGRPSPPVIEELDVIGKGLEAAISNYAKRNYGFSIEFAGRRTPGAQEN